MYHLPPNPPPPPTPSLLASEARGPSLTLTVQTAQGGAGRAEKTTYLGDCAWKSNLSRAAFLWEKRENRVGYLRQTGTCPDTP